MNTEGPKQSTKPLDRVGCRFRGWNERVSVSVYESMFGGMDVDAINAFRKAPYSWWILLIPIAGIAGFYGVVWEENLERRRREMEAHRNSINEKGR